MSQSKESLSAESFLSSIVLPVFKFFTIPSLVFWTNANLALTASDKGTFMAPLTSCLSKSPIS